MHRVTDVDYSMRAEHDELPVSEEYLGRLAHLYGVEESLDGCREVRAVRRSLRRVERRQLPVAGRQAGGRRGCAHLPNTLRQLGWDR